MRGLVRSVVVLAMAAALSAAPVTGAEAAPGGAGGRSPGSPGFGHIGTVVDSQTETDLATGDVTVFTTTSEYDSRGRLVHYREEETLNGAVTFYRDGTSEFGAGGTERSVLVVDGDGDGAAPADVIVSTFVYDNRGNLKAVDTTYDFGSDGTIDRTDHEAYTRDQKGRELTYHLESPNFIEDATFTYDRHGNPTSVVDILDDPTDPGSPDEKFVGTSEYDAHGNLLSGSDERYTYDDAGNATLSSSGTFTSVYGKAGRRVGEHSTFDSDGDGTVDVVSDTVIGYDKRGNTASYVQTTVEGGVTSVFKDLETWDHRGNRLSVVLEDYVDGQLTYRRVEHDTYDTRGRFTGHTESEDFDGDGVVDTVLRQVVTGWDSRGRVTSFHTTDEDGAGTVLAVHDVTIEWHRYYQVRTSFHDDDNDGNYDRKLVLVVPLVF